MDAYRLALKFYIEDAAKVDRERFVPMFHLWIRDQGLSSHLLIDVADYQHVANGPGVVLVSHEANISMDESDGRLGLLYQRKRPFGNSFADRFQTVLSATLEACLKLEHDPALGGHVKFQTDGFILRIQDRLLAPNVPETLQQIRSDVETPLKQLYAVPSVKFDQNANPDQAFEVTIKTGAAPGVANLMDRIGLASATK